MRIGNVQPGRPQYYDRNPGTRSMQYQAGTVAPHGATTRFSYTVPSNAKAYLQTVTCHQVRDAAAAPAGLCVLQVQWGTDSGGGGIAAWSATVDPAVGAKDNSNMAGLGLLTPANTLTCLSSDVSTGGSHFFEASCIVVEFDT